VALGFDARDNLVPLSRRECTPGDESTRERETASEEDSVRRVNGEDSRDAIGRGLETRRCFDGNETTAEARRAVAG